jgi:5-methylcytosine-specific restriction endonuclease McrA
VDLFIVIDKIPGYEEKRPPFTPLTMDQLRAALGLKPPPVPKETRRLFIEIDKIVEEELTRPTKPKRPTKRRATKVVKSPTRSRSVTPKPMPPGRPSRPQERQPPQIHTYTHPVPAPPQRRSHRLNTSKGEAYICAYCGLPADTRDHVIPRSYRSQVHYVRAKFTDLTTDIVWCCRECNNLASNLVFRSFAAKKRYLKGRIRERYAEVLATPGWSERELNELGRTLRTHVEAALRLKEIIEERLRF